MPPISSQAPEEPLSEFRFEKRRVHATLTLTTGATVRGCFFVVTSLVHGGPERVIDLLNGEHEFFPFRRDDGTTPQINRAHLAVARLRSGAGEVELEAGYAVATRRRVVMTLSTGGTIEGTVFVDRPAGRDRLSDYARHWKHFLYLVTPTDTLIVNATHIVDVVEQAA